jgi:hypothetical protein
VRLAALACVVALGCTPEPDQSEPAQASPSREAEPVEPPEPASDPSPPVVEPPPPAGPGWCSADGWCWLHPDPHGNDLHAVWALAPDDAWAVGDSATVVHWDGKAWSRVALDVPTGLDLRAIWAAGPERIFVAGEDGSVSIFDGRSLPIAKVERHELHPLLSIDALWGSSAQDVHALTGTINGESLLFHYDGATWTRVDPHPLPNATLLAGSAADDVWLFGTYEGAARFDGSAWQREPTKGRDWSSHDAWIGKVDGFPRAVVVGGDDHFVHHDGRKWKVGRKTRELATNVAKLGTTLTAVTASSSGDIWVGTGEGSLLVWKDEQWSIAAQRDARLIRDLASAGDSIFAVGDMGTQLVIRPGETVPEPAGPRGHSIRAMAALGEHVWVAEELELWHWDGKAWTAHEINSGTNALWPASPSEVHLVGKYGYKRFDGTTLHAEPLLPHRFFEGHDVWGSGPADVWIAAGEHLMHFDGQGWQAHTIEVEARRLHGSALGNLLVVGPRKQAKDEFSRVGEWAIARHHEGTWTIDLDLDEDSAFVRAHAAEGGFAIDRWGRAWLRDQAGWHDIEDLPRSNVANYTIVGAWMHGPDAIWALDADGAIFRFDGRAWRAEVADLQLPRAIVGTGSHLLVAEYHGGVVRRALPLP